MPIEIACILSVHERGFAFAKLLTGPGTAGSGEIFLNEARVAALKEELPSLVGAVVAVQPVLKSDGRLSALQGWPVALYDSYTASRLWERVAQHREMTPEALAPAHDVLPETPALLPLALVLLDARCSDALAQTLVSRLPAEAWIVTEKDLHLPLEHVGLGVRKKVLLHLVEHDPLRAYYLLLSSSLRAGITLSASQIENLWLAGEPWELPVGQLLASWSREVAFAGMLAWASRDHESQSARREASWPVIANVMARPNATWPRGWDKWAALASAPPSLAWLLGRQRHASWLEAITTLHLVVQRSTKMLVFSGDSLLASLDADDAALAKQWSNGSRADNPAIVDRLRAQMLTARAAEKCALRYFEGLGQAVRDIAITQLQDGATDWTVMDLRLGELHGIDVKNCRRTPHGGLRSGKWKVKALKSDAAGNPVTLLGVSSPYTAFDDTGALVTRVDRSSRALRLQLPAAEGEDAMVVLGVTNAAEMHRLMARFKELADIDMPEPSRLSEMPAWSWDYPTVHYGERNEVVSGVLLEWSESRTPLMQRVLAFAPPALASLLDLDLPVASVAALTEQQRDYLERMREQWRSEKARSRGTTLVPRLPWLYLFTLHAWLRWRQMGRRSDVSRIGPLFRATDNPDATVAVIKATTLASGVGIVDPARTLEALLRALSMLDTTVPQEIFAGMSRFTLQPNGVLRARFPDRRMRTLVAHCGGRLPNFVECGSWPLVYGDEKSCQCGRLICRQCLSCTAAGMSCEHENERKGSRQRASEEAADPEPARRSWARQDFD
ncbi:MAG: hypothetical protein INH12_26955 [Cupriavidus sp.]|uniref:hypothetical protein n=1 Tax=Cupriavidus sp. TaxID=1873897 RepID=UPI0025C4CC48|nr:hypothetical protein [Cupriavidus sp.]MCA3188105.1 hypothetical protein [Cupriavidus sp.]MCA3193719.1 hypothetical protein [Cupriavidus sp.]MCA3199037.1 hypothetical protein [Cupriavidus sp.]MCA3235124.1 hypothetical protein [Cupriavidus sp.]